MDEQDMILTAEAVENVCTACLQAIGDDIDAVGVSLLISPTMRIPVAAAGGLADRGEQWEFTLGEGPGLQAFRTSRPVLAADLSTPEQVVDWPIFADYATASGLGAVFAFPVLLNGHPLAVLTLYRRRAGNLAPAQQRLAESYAAGAAGLLVKASCELTHDDEDQHGSALSPELAVVHRAAGMIGAQRECSAEEALAYLRAAAYRYQCPVAELATEIIEGRRFLE